MLKGKINDIVSFLFLHVVSEESRANIDSFLLKAGLEINDLATSFVAFAESRQLPFTLIQTCMNILGILFKKYFVL